MKAAIDETERRREKQIKFNEEHGIVPQQIKKQVKDIIDGVYHEEDSGKGRLKGKNKVKVGEIHNEEDAIKEIAKTRKKPCSRQLGICSLKRQLCYAIELGILKRTYCLDRNKFRRIRLSR